MLALSLIHTGDLEDRGAPDTPQCVTPKADRPPVSTPLHPRVLKELSQVIARPLFLIFMDSLLTGMVPADWRKANVVLIFKKGSRYISGNYRPVSLTSIVCKLLEGTIRDFI